MATLSELVDTVAEVEGMDPPTVALIARYAREAGFIQKKGRGPSAAHMGITDAANLLIAVNASAAAFDAPAVIPRYRDLMNFDYSRPPKVCGTFGDALELIIQSAIEGELPKTFLSKNVSTTIRDAFRHGSGIVTIEFRRPEPSGAISIFTSSSLVSRSSAKTRLDSFFSQSRQWSKTFLKTGDRTDETRIGLRTILSVARTLRSSQQHDPKA